MQLLAGKGNFRAQNSILRALLHSEFHFEGTFLRVIVINKNKTEKNFNFIG